MILRTIIVQHLNHKAINMNPNKPILRPKLEFFKYLMKFWSDQGASVLVNTRHISFLNIICRIFQFKETFFVVA